MLRFYDKHEIKSDILNIIIAEKGESFTESIWQKGIEFFKNNLKEQARELKVFPVLDENQEVVCYGWQDEEANRELRMIRELEENKDALQFGDIFPDVQEVLVCGCNELAYFFIKYLEQQGVSVSVTGRYWEYLGYQDSGYALSGAGKRLVVYAEREFEQTGDIYDQVIGSASDEFECVDQIYEANVVRGRIKNAVGDFEFLINKINGKDVYLIGTSRAAQDTYDLLYTHGIDVHGFVCGRNTWIGARFFLGKKIISSRQAVHQGRDAVYISCMDEYSTLSSGNADFYDYCGYRRNEQFFLIRDYANIPCSNLIHVLKGKNVLLAGDSRLCAIVKKYLDEVEEGDINVQCGELSECRLMDEKDIFCRVNLWYCVDNKNTNKNERNFREELFHIGTVMFTGYFSAIEALVAIEQYRNGDINKYSLKQLMPKGILLGAIPYYSGNMLFRGIMDGHPDVLEALPFSAWDDNLFLYCIRLAGEKAEKILAVLEEMLADEIGEISVVFPDWDRFARSAEELLKQKEYFTSQELFLLFRIAYAEMMRGEKIVNISQKIIYWEPHIIPRNEIPLLAKWLESELIQGQTIVMPRNQVMRTGSGYKYEEAGGGNCFFAGGMIPEEWMIRKESLQYKHWQEFKIRFEDLKLHPKTELLRICNKLGIAWSDTMLRTTAMGKAQDYLGTRDFDLKPVFHQYEEYLSEFDRLRILILSAPYQKMYGYPYVDCRMFSRKELWKMFLKEFRFQSQVQYVNKKERISYNMAMHSRFRRQLWKVRAYTVINTNIPEFGPVEIGVSVPERQKLQSQQAQLIPQTLSVSKQKEREREKIDNILTFARSQDKLILYGIGKDCGGLLDRLSIAEQGKFLFCDRKAVQGECVYHGQKVLAPQELCDKYQEYKILITSSMYSSWIRWELQDMGISADRIICNTVRLWEDT